MPVTRKEVANRAAVSEATVSYVVNNGPRPVAPDTRARVLQAIDELGYHPSDVARSLRKQRTSTIGLIVPDTANPFYGEIARIIENVGYANGYTVMLCNSNLDAEREASYVNLLRTRRVEGAVIIPTTAESVATLRAADIRTIVLEYEIEGAYCLVADDFEGGRMVTRYLLNLGHRHIACIGRAGDKTTSQKRVEGYKHALSVAGVPLDPELIVETEPEIAAGEAIALRLLDQVVAAGRNRAGQHGFLPTASRRRSVLNRPAGDIGRGGAAIKQLDEVVAERRARVAAATVNLTDHHARGDAAYGRRLNQQGSEQGKESNQAYRATKTHFFSSTRRWAGTRSWRGEKSANLASGRNHSEQCKHSCRVSNCGQDEMFCTRAMPAQKPLVPVQNGIERESTATGSGRARWPGRERLPQTAGK